ncbi:membrane protein, partial [Streptomyces sp. NRRL WC-3701]
SVLPWLQANCPQRSLYGLLTFSPAFLLREHPLGGLGPQVSLGLVAVAARAGKALGAAGGAWLGFRAPELIIAVELRLSLALTVTAAVFCVVLGRVEVTAAAALE